MVLLRCWLTLRQMAHIRAHRAQVPAQFAGRIALAAHQKAADYSTTRCRFGLLSLAVEIAVLLGLTWGGGLQMLHDFWAPRFDGLVGEEAADRVHVGGGALDQFTCLCLIVIGEAEPLDVVVEILAQPPGNAFGGLGRQPPAVEGADRLDDGQAEKTGVSDNASASSPALCSLDNPDCEACQ